LRRHRIVGDVRGKGFFAGIELVRNPETKEPFEFTEYCRAANTLVDRCFRNGLIIYPGGGTVDGFRGDHVLVAPPLIMQRPEIDLMVGILDRAMGETADTLFGSRLPSP
jgi:adenosylmethionine-8-amino-7-oxononanoate aminotransferase